MRCLVTGASGFVGANLVRRLFRDGHEVHVFLRPTHHDWRLKAIAQSLRIHPVDISDYATLRETAHRIQPQWVFHLAAYGAYSSQTDFSRMVSVNITGTSALLDACADIGAQSFIYTGSSSEYGYKDHPPKEDEPLEPNSHYAITKAAATHYCQFTARTRNVNAVAVRLYSIYGPYEEPTRLIPTLISHGLRGTLPPLVSPATARDFVYVEDAVDALIAIAGQSPKRGAVYNLCTGVQTTMATVVEAARRLMNIKAEPEWSTMQRRSWDTDVWIGSPAALLSEIDWRAKIDFATGLARTIEHYKGFK